MSKEVKVIAWCDGDHVEPTPAELERVVQVDGGSPILLDLCTPCDKLFTDLARLMERGAETEVPEKPKRKRKSPKPPEPVDERPTEERGMSLICPEPDCIDPRTEEQYVAPSRSALGAHLKLKHKSKLSDYDWSPAD